MPCYHPLQAILHPYVHESGEQKRSLIFSRNLRELFYQNKVLPQKTEDGRDIVAIPCSRCKGCRTERARQWGVRLSHEASLYEKNSFLTLTFSPEGLREMCPTGSLSKKHMQDFNKRLRERFSDTKIRFFYCGEYGEKNFRPHYHSLVFNWSPPDLEYWRTVNGNKYYTSNILSSLWPYGYSVVGEVNFSSAA